MLAAERIRDPVTADATYVLLSHDFDDELEVVAVSGLPEDLLRHPARARLPRHARPAQPRLPVVVPDLADVRGRRCWPGRGCARWSSYPWSWRASLVGAAGAPPPAVRDGFTDDRPRMLQRFADTIALDRRPGAAPGRRSASAAVGSATSPTPGTCSPGRSTRT